MGRLHTEINLRTTSPEGEVKMFNSFPEAASGLGFSECAVKKASILEEIGLVNTS